jgi:hypothetical protein
MSIQKNKKNKTFLLSFLGLSVLLYLFHIYEIDIKAQRRLSCHVVLFFFLLRLSLFSVVCVVFFLLGPLYILLLVMSILIFYLLLCRSMLYTVYGVFFCSLLLLYVGWLFIFIFIFIFIFFLALDVV